MINIGSAKELGELIMHERKAQGLAQTQLAGLSGVGITFLSNLENGKQTAELGKTLNVLATLGLVIISRREHRPFHASRSGAHAVSVSPVSRMRIA